VAEVLVDAGEVGEGEEAALAWAKWGMELRAVSILGENSGIFRNEETFTAKTPRSKSWTDGKSRD